MTINYESELFFAPYSIYCCNDDACNLTQSPKTLWVIWSLMEWGLDVFLHGLKFKITKTVRLSHDYFTLKYAVEPLNFLLR